MKFSAIGLVTIITAPLFLSACSTSYTTQMLDDAGDAFEKGDYIFGTIMGATALTVGPIADIITVGGTLDSQESTEFWTTTLASAQGSSSSVLLDQQQFQQRKQLEQQHQIQQQRQERAALDVPGITDSSTISNHGSTSSPIVAKAQSKRYQFSNCPIDTQDVKADLTNNDVLQSNHSHPILDTVRKYGGYDKTIALLAAQRETFITAANEAAQTANQSWGGLGEPYATSNCPVADGIYCSAIHAMWLYSEQALVVQYISDAVKCHKNAGTPL